jgi:hypothetical protein
VVEQNYFASAQKPSKQTVNTDGRLKFTNRNVRLDKIVKSIIKMGNKYFCSQNQINNLCLPVKRQKLCKESNVKYPNETHHKENRAYGIFTVKRVRNKMW